MVVPTASSDKVNLRNTAGVDSTKYPGSDCDSTTPDDTIDEYNPAETRSIISNEHASREEVERLHSLSREVTNLTFYEGDLRVDPDAFDLRKLLYTQIKQSELSGVKLRDMGVSFENMTVRGIDQSYAFLPTLSDVLNMPASIFRTLRSIGHKPEKDILHELNGYARSGEMVLVLGRPGAGCSTFLKALTGTDSSMYTGIFGDIEYDGLPRNSMVRHFKQDLIYCPELDTHHPHLTVEQTLDFAIRCKMPDKRVNDMSKDDYVKFMREMLATVFGLRHTFKTKVGNDFIRGVSGGERKRVSIAEALACQGTVYCWDNATRGLDASTALEYAQAIRVSTDILRSTAFVTIYQASENIYETFDKVTVLYKGRQIYFGSTKEAKAYFEDMGFECPPRQSTAEFLTAITDPHGRFPKPGYENKVPRTAEDFEAYWLASDAFKKLKNEIQDYKSEQNPDETKRSLIESIKQQKQRGQRTGSHYTVNFYEQFRLNMMRGFQSMKGDKAYAVTQTIAAIAQSLIVGSLYYNTPNDVSGAFSRGGVIFFSVLYLSLMGLAEISNSFNQRPIMMKQHNYSFYHPSACAVADALSSVPLTLFITIVFSLILYFLSNLKRDAGAYFTFLLFSFLVSLSMNGLFKAISAWNKTISAANAFAGVLILAALMYSSFMIQRPSMRVYFKWISYINPVLYGFEAMLTTEFHGRKMECSGANLVPRGPGYDSSRAACAFQGSEPGLSIVSGDAYVETAFTYSFSHVWRNFGILIGFIVFFIVVAAIGFEVVRPVSGGVDRLFFLRGKKPEHILTPEEKAKADAERGGEGDSDLEKVKPEKTAASSNSALADLESKDIFCWKNVDYVIPYDGGQRKLLDDVSGFCIPGKLTALMGESGAGKTTLLNVLAQRVNMGVITGDILVNGKPLDGSFSRRTGYVQQQDIHLAETTVREALRFSAQLRRPNSVPDSEKFEYVEKIIEILEMEEYSDAIVGQLGSGLNVEQRKKLTIGVELVAKPSLLLFLDEPTSGLDSQSAWSIVKLLRDLASAGQAILCTIHQPSATLFEEFDRLLLLRKGGQTVYFGEIGKRSRTILDYFERNGARKCLEQENPAEYILEAIGAGATASTDKNWFEVWSNSQEKIDVEKRVSQLIEEGKQKAGLSEKEAKELQNPYATNIPYQFVILVRRTFLAFWRKPLYIMAKTFLMTISGLFIGFTFFGLSKSITGMQNGMFCAFLSVVVSAPVINQIQEQCMAVRDVFEGRERLSNTYRWWLLVLAQYVCEVPFNFVAAAFMFVSLYFPTRADFSAPHSGVFYLTHGIFLQLFNISFGFLILYFSPDVQSAAVLVSFFYSFIVGFSGIVQPVSLMPGFWTFMNKASPYTYIIQNLVASFLYDREVHCSDKEMAYVSPPEGQTCAQFLGDFIQSAGGYLEEPNSTTQCAYCKYTNANEYLLTIQTKYSNIWRNVGFYCAYIVFNICFCLFMYKVIRLSSWKLPTIKLPSIRRKKA
uniref:Atp dependent transporter multidrug resistance n=1 Tax=Candidozyma auris TaxID=498019 RepID=A0A0L0P8N6_CANAR